MPEQVLTEGECDVDVCVLGTGLTESLAAAAFARHGKRVLHLDRATAYGGNWRAVSLTELEAWAATVDGTRAPVVAAASSTSQPAPDAAVDVGAPEASAPLLSSAEETAAMTLAERSQGKDEEGKEAEGKEAEGQEADKKEEEEKREQEAEAEAPEPEPDLSGYTVVDLEEGPPESCFVKRHLAWDPFGTRSPEMLEELQTRLRKSSNGFNIDLVPRLLFARSELVDVLVESGVARYLEFQGLKSARVLTPEGLVSVPLTKSDIFQDSVLTLPEKRVLMRFITSTASLAGSLAFESPARLGVDQQQKVKAPSTDGVLEGVDPEVPWATFLEKQGLSERLRDFLTYAICLWDWAEDAGTAALARPLSTGEGLQFLGRFVSSLGLHGRGSSMPLLYPMYGAAEVAQGFTRMCALHRGLYALRSSATRLLATPEEGTGDAKRGWRAAGIVTNRGEVVRTKAVIGSPDHLLQRGAASSSSSTASVSCRRLTVVTDSPALGQDGLNLCVVPPRSFDPPLANAVQVLQLDWMTGSCPRGYHVLHLSQALATATAGAAPASEGQASENAGEVASPFADLDRVLEALLPQCGGREHCLLRCAYEHRPRNTRRWDPSTEGGSILQSCADGHSLAVCCDPDAVPQLLVGAEIPEARGLFLGSPAHGDQAPVPEDFLKKPQHVAEEERAGAMEELEHFNESMRTAEQPQLLEAHIETHADGAAAEDAAEGVTASVAAIGEDVAKGGNSEVAVESAADRQERPESGGSSQADLAVLAAAAAASS